MNVLNQNRKELEEMLVGSNSDPVTTTLRDLHNFKTTLPILQVLERDPHSSAFLSQRISWVLGQAQWPNLSYEGQPDLPLKLAIMHWLALGTFPLANGSKLVLPHPNKWLQTHFLEQNTSAMNMNMFMNSYIAWICSWTVRHVTALIVFHYFTYVFINI